MERLVEEWLRLDKDPVTRREIETLAAEKNAKELESRLSTRLTFGTAGLRARMGAGFSRLNCLTIVQTSQGLADYILQNVSGSAAAGIVIGYDSRHNSKKFAELAAAVFTTKGIKVWWYEDLAHTPMVPFGVKVLGAAAGIMITASHNPAQDNGYKVYGSNGCQINSPTDAHIAAAILNNLELIAWRDQEESPLKTAILPYVKSKYLEVVCQTSAELKPKLTNNLDFVYTPMHGVGLEYLMGALEKIGIAESMTVVEQQARPDPDFPTVKYPNPEEKGALDLAISTADEKGIRLILANDPDADRFGAAEKIEEHWHQFTGDQVGVLLAYYIYVEKGGSANSSVFMLTSAVSSQMLSSIALEEGFSAAETLTGFKWLGNCALDLQKKGNHVLFAYEEALGYMIPGIVHDKDGIIATILFLSACAKWGSPWAMLQRLYRKYGYFETVNTYWRSPDIATTQKIFAKIRSQGEPYPASVGDRKVVRWRDLTLAFDSATDDHVPVLPSSESSQMITCWLSRSADDQGVRFTIRASGTEPKIKIYLECQSTNADLAKRGALRVLCFVYQDWFSDPCLAVEEKYSQLLNS